MSGERPSTESHPNHQSAKLNVVSKVAPARSPIERAVVWGLIAVLLVIVAWEFTAHLGYTKALRSFKEGINRSENGTPFFAAELPNVVGGKSPSSHDEITDAVFGRCIEETYEWNGPIRKRAIHVIMMLDDKHEIMTFKTAGAEDEPAEAPVPSPAAPPSIPADKAPVKT